MKTGSKIDSTALEPQNRPDGRVSPQKRFCTGVARGKNGLCVVAVANEFAIGDETTELELKYGTYPAGRRKTQKGIRYVMQRWNRAAAESVANQLQQEVANGAPGIPVYIGHPDVPELAGRYPNKAAQGWITETRTGDDSATMVVVWNEKPITKKEFAFFSPYWFGSVVHDDGATATLDVQEIGSVGLTNTPNIHEFRIPNEADGDEADDFEETNNPTERDNQMKQQLIQLLGLPSDSDDEAVMAALRALKEQADQLAAMKAEKEAAEKAKADAEKAQAESKEAFENERQGRVELVIASALSDGRITAADVARWKKLLGENFAVNSVAIANEAPKFKKEAVSSKTEAMAVANTADRITAIQDAVSEQMNKGLDYDAAHRAVRKAHPELFKK